MASSNVPRLRFKGFNDNWTEEELNSMGEIYNGLTGKTKADFGSGNSQYLTYLSINKHAISTEMNTEYVSVKDNENQNYVKKGDILFTTSSETPEEVGMSSVWDSKKDVYLNSFSFGYRFSKNIYRYFAAYLFRSRIARKKIFPLAQGISRYNLSKTNFLKLVFEFPSFPEQQYIGNFFIKLDYLIDLHSQKMEQLKKLKQGYMQKVFPQEGETVPRLRFSGFSSDWEKVRLSEYFEYKNGHSLEKKVVQGGQMNVINLNSIGMDGKLKDSGKYINNDDTEKLERNDIIMILSDITHGNLIGITAIIPSNNKYVLNQRVGLLRKQKAKDINQKFVHYLLNSDRKYFKRMCAGMSQLNLSKKDVIDYTFLLPSLEEQMKIANLLANIDDLIDMENEKIMKIREQKTAYLQKMFI